MVLFTYKSHVFETRYDAVVEIVQDIMANTSSMYLLDGLLKCVDDILYLLMDKCLYTKETIYEYNEQYIKKVYFVDTILIVTDSENNNYFLHKLTYETTEFIKQHYKKIIHHGITDTTSTHDLIETWRHQYYNDIISSYSDSNVSETEDDCNGFSRGELYTYFTHFCETITDTISCCYICRESENTSGNPVKYTCCRCRVPMCLICLTNWNIQTMRCGHCQNDTLIHEDTYVRDISEARGVIQKPEDICYIENSTTPIFLMYIWTYMYVKGIFDKSIAKKYFFAYVTNPTNIFCINQLKVLIPGFETLCTDEIILQTYNLFKRLTYVKA